MISLFLLSSEGKFFYFLCRAGGKAENFINAEAKKKIPPVFIDHRAQKKRGNEDQPETSK